MAGTNTELAQVSGSNMAVAHELQDDMTSQYLSFELADELYGVDILRVQEIKGWTQVTRIPNTPEYMRGVLNLRGTVVPIIDMRRRFNLENSEYTATTVVIVLSVKSDTGERVIGFVVDAVSDVLNVTPENMKQTPDFGSAVNTDFISGLASVDENMVMLLDVDKLFDADEMAVIKTAEQQQ